MCDYELGSDIINEHLMMMANQQIHHQRQGESLFDGTTPFDVEMMTPEEPN